MNSLSKPIVITVTASFIAGCADSDVRMVRDSYLNIDSSVTVGNALDNKEICETTNWHSYEDDRGRVFVRHECHFKGFEENIHNLLTSRIDDANRLGEETSSNSISEINRTIENENERIERYRKHIDNLDVYDEEQDLYSSTGHSEMRRVALISSIDEYREKHNILKESISSLNRKEYESVPSDDLKNAVELIDRYDPDIHYPTQHSYVDESGYRIVDTDDNVDRSLYSDFMSIIRNIGYDEMISRYSRPRSQQDIVRREAILNKFFEEAPSNIENVIEHIRLSLIEEYENNIPEIEEILNEYESISDIRDDEIEEVEGRIESSMDYIERERERIPELERRLSEFNDERRENADEAIDFYQSRMENTDSFYEYFDFRIDQAGDSFTLTSGGVLVKTGDDVIGRSSYGRLLNQRIEMAYEYSGDDIDEYLDQFIGNFYPSNFAPPPHQLIN